MFTLAVILAAFQAQAFTEYSNSPRPKQWTCQASDFQGAFGTGTAPTREEAHGRAFNNCMMRSRTGNCMVTSCSAL